MLNSSTPGTWASRPRCRKAAKNYSNYSNFFPFRDSSVAKRGGQVAKVARKQLESQIGHSVVTSLNAKDYFKSLTDPSDSVS